MKLESVIPILYKLVYIGMVISVFILAFKGLLIISDMEVPDQDLINDMCGMVMLICSGIIALIVLGCTPFTLKTRINELDKRLKELEKENKR